MMTLIELLLRQSERGVGRIPGDQLRVHQGPALERLLDAGVLEELPPVEDWPVCPDCDCGADARPIRSESGGLRAICPAGRTRDLALDKEDLRRFVISERRLALEVLGGDASAVSEPMPGLWHRSGIDGRSLFLTLRRSVGESPQLLYVLRAAARGAPMILVAPALSAQAELRLASELIVVRATDAVSLDPRGTVVLRTIDMVSRHAGTRPRLRVSIPDRQVHVDGAARSVPGYRFDLLTMLIDAWQRSTSVNANEISRQFSLRRATELKTDLKFDLSAGHPDPDQVHSWIVTERRPTRYRLALAPGQVEIIR